MVGSGLGLRAGILFKRASALELITRIRVMLFDKTGTLTVGRPELESLAVLDGDESNALSFAAIAAAGSSHPLSRAVTASAQARNLAPQFAPGDSREMPGLGITAERRGKQIALGNDRLMAQVGVEVGKRLEGEWRPDTGLPLDLRLQLVVLERQHAAPGVVDQHHLLRAEEALGDDQRADDIVGGDPASVADDMGVAGLQPEDGGKIEPPIHAADHRDVAGGHVVERAEARVEAGGENVALVQYVLDHGHGHLLSGSHRCAPAVP